MDSVEQTLQTVSAQQEQLNRALLLMSNNNGGTKSKEYTVIFCSQQYWDTVVY